VRHVGPPPPFASSLPSYVHRHAGTLEAAARLAVTLEREADTRREREHVGAHRLELLVPHGDDLDAALLEGCRFSHATGLADPEHDRALVVQLVTSLLDALRQTSAIARSPSADVTIAATIDWVEL
jgi:hypothetical protein